METRFKKKSQIIDVGVTSVGAVLSVGTMLYGVSQFGLGEAWPELVLNLCYIACLVMMGCTFSSVSTASASTTGVRYARALPFIELIKWAYRHQLYQQVLTLIESHAPTNLVNSGIFFYCDDEARKDEVTNILALQRLELKPYEYYKMDDIDHYFIKNYDRAGVRLNGSKGEDRTLAYAVLRAQSIESRDPAKICGHTACGSIDTVQNVLYAYYHLGDVRNKISHADSNAMAERRLIVSESDVSYAMVLMRESILSNGGLKRRSLRSPPMMYGKPQIASGTGKPRQSLAHPTGEGNSGRIPENRQF